jgi:tricorn protease
MKKAFFILSVVFSVTGALINHARATEKQLIGARYPAISPDGKQIVFSYMGDLWLVSSDGGKAFRLTNHAAYDLEPIWSPDGQWLVFSSNRMGNNDVYIMPAKGGKPQQLTYHTGEDIATDFSPDGHWIIFRSNRSSSSGIFKISIDGGNAIPVLDTYWSWPFHARISPDGNRILFSLGMENYYWERRGYRGTNSAKIWKIDLNNNQAKLIIADSSNCFWPDWSSDGQHIYFVSDREFDDKNIWTATKDGKDLRPITQFRDGDVHWLSVAAKVPMVTYERKFDIWITDLTTGDSHPVLIDAPAETKANRTFFIENGSVTEFRLSPDGKKIAAVVRGEIFVMASDGGYARDITNTPWRERNVEWDKESQNLVYVSDADANPDLYIISAMGNEKPKRLTQTYEDELVPRFSPDGKWIAYYSGKRQIRLIQPDGKENQLLIEDDFGGRIADKFVWSPDSRYLVVSPRRNGNWDICAVDIQSKEEFQLTNTAYDEHSAAWSPDGKFLLFLSNRFGHSFPEFTGKQDIYQVHIEPQKPEFDEDKFEKLFESKEKENKSEKKEDKKESIPEIRFKLDNLDRQTERITNTLGNDREFVLSPKDTNTIYFVSNIDGKHHLWKTSLKEEERGKYEPFMPAVDNPRNLQYDADGKYLYYLSNGKVGRIDLDSKKKEDVSFETKIQVDKIADYEQMLAELYYTLQHYFYDAQHHQVNWKQIYEEFRPVLQQVREDQDFYDYANEMLGYLNSSHTGISGPSKDKIEKPSAHLGALWKFSDHKVTLEKILKDGPLYAHRDSVAVGDELIVIDGEAIDASENIWQHLNGKLEKRVKITLKSQRLHRKIELALNPISYRDERQLILEEWIESRREIVKQKTDDKVAYIYMSAMGWRNLERFLKELERDAVPRKGLILDLRCNFGGNVHDRVLQALTKPVYAKWQIRGLSETQQSTYGLTNKPVILLINEVTLSDGEMTANGFKTLKRGPIIGNTTYGWLIFTTHVGLMNGGYFRLPYWGCYTMDGQDLETIGGVKPDIYVLNDLNHELKQQDPQLEKAIQVALEKIK